MRICFILFVAVLAFLSVVQAADKNEACKLPKEAGPCRASALNYYYNNDVKECQEFIYGGCEGNDNRFRSKKECEQACV